MNRLNKNQPLPRVNSSVASETFDEWIDETEGPRESRWVLRGIALAIILLLVWAALAEIDQVTRAPAQLIASSRTQLVQSVDSGVVTELHVAEGDVVKAGQLLATLEKRRAGAAVDDTRAKVAALKITLTRLQAEVYEKPLRFDPELLEFGDYIRNQTDLYNKRRTAFQQDIRAMTGILNLAKQELAINQQLLTNGDVSKADVLRLERSVADLNAQLVSKRNKYFQDAQSEMTKAQEELFTQSEILKDRTQVLKQTELFAPMAGVVNNIRINTVGGVVRAGEVVLELLPTGEDLIAEAKVSPTDIAFVEIGQRASVKLDAYDSTIFGAMNGEVIYISPDVLKEDTRQGEVAYYRVHVRILGQEFSGKTADSIELRPGLTATVDIKAMERSVLSYLLKPVMKTVSNAMGER
jgi:adhesin transport system membrane fusion protein